MRTINLTRGKQAIVDNEDYAAISKFKWYCEHPYPNLFYARRVYRDKEGNRKLILMHRAILKAPAGSCIDHVNHDGLDNRKTNLRFCTSQQNNRNRRHYKDKSSKYKGVTLKKSTGKWVGQIILDRKWIFLGTFADEVEAAKAYDRKAIELFGEYAVTNFERIEGEGGIIIEDGSVFRGFPFRDTGNA